MRIKTGIFILSGFVLFLFLLVSIRSCSLPPKKGLTVYTQYCASCHLDDGQGFRNLIPPLTDAIFLQDHIDEFICIVGYGVDEEFIINGVKFNLPMAGIEELTPTQIANVANYVYGRWGGVDKKFTPKEVEIALANCTQ